MANGNRPSGGNPSKMAVTTKKTAEDLLAVTFEKIARSLPDKGPAYADLAGNVYDKKSYLERLKNDSDFAETQLKAFIQPPPPDDDKGITPREQVNLARRFEDFAKTHDPNLGDFLRANPALTETYKVRDIKRVLNTIKYEFGIKAIVPDELKDADDDTTLSRALREPAVG